MRQIVLDTETTGLDTRDGHRIIEIAGIEIVQRRPTQRHFHYYLDPERDIDPGAQEVHGISREFLVGKPRFAEIAPEFLDFIRGAELVIHNAPFDCGFLNHELSLLGLAPLETVCAGICDTLKMAKELHPGKKNNLNALCERYAIDNSQRTLHGALLDAELLAEVYLALTRGQDSLMIDLSPTPRLHEDQVVRRERPELTVLRASAEECAEHERLLASIDAESKGQCLWRTAETQLA